MKRKTTALMTVLALAVGISACKHKPVPQTDTANTVSTEETEETAEETTEETEEEVTPEEQLRTALGGMPYYGDAAGCKMTAEQAAAFAQIIADGLAGDFSFRGGYSNYDYDILTWSEPFQVFAFDMEQPAEIDRFHVMLGDFAGDGVPYLYLYGSQEPSSFEVYGWNGSEPILSCTGEIGLRSDYLLTEETDGRVSFTEQCFNAGTKCRDEYIWAAVVRLEHAFKEGNTELVCERALAKWEPLDDSEPFSIVENGEQIKTCTEEEAEAFLEEASHHHELPYTCFYDMEPCTLEEMVNYLNAYADVMSGGQSVPVEIEKAEIVTHEGTGIITKGEVPQWKADSLEVLRHFINGEAGMGCVNDGDSVTYVNGFGEEWEGTKSFYFDLTDINSDGSQDLLVSYKDEYLSYTNLYLGSSFKDGLFSINGANRSEGTYLCTGGSVFAVAYLYVCDGTAFSIVSALEEEEVIGSDGYDMEYQYTLTENGTKRKISEEEFHSVWEAWESRNTDISANTHLDIENIENTFQVNIDIRYSGKWFVTSIE